MTPAVKEMIDMFKSKGLTVYGPKELTTYVWFTDGTRIGYAQCSRYDGVTYSTVHMPNRETGTGFSAKDVEEALSFAPSWVYPPQARSVIKYRDFEHFRSRHWQPLVQY